MKSADSRGRRHPEAPDDFRTRLPARPRPRHPLDRVPAADRQDAGLRVGHGRPLPHAPDAQPRGVADRAVDRAEPRAQPGPDRGRRARARPRPRAVRPQRRRRARRADEGPRRLRAQPPVAPDPRLPRDPVPGVPRAEPDLRGPRVDPQAPAALRRARRTPTIHPGRARCSRRSSSTSPTASPTTATTSTTASAPASSIRAELDSVDAARGVNARTLARHPGLDGKALVRRSSPASINFLVRDLLKSTAQRLEELGIRSVEDVRKARQDVVALSPEVAKGEAGLRQLALRQLLHPRPRVGDAAPLEGVPGRALRGVREGAAAPAAAVPRAREDRRGPPRGRGLHRRDDRRLRAAHLPPPVRPAAQEES